MSPQYEQVYFVVHYSTLILFLWILSPSSAIQIFLFVSSKNETSDLEKK